MLSYPGRQVTSSCEIVRYPQSQVENSFLKNGSTGQVLKKLRTISLLGRLETMLSTYRSFSSMSVMVVHDEVSVHKRGWTSQNNRAPTTNAGGALIKPDVVVTAVALGVLHTG